MISENNRPTRLRRSAAMRDMVRETKLSMDDIMYPLFIVEGKNVKSEIASMKGQYHLSVDMLKTEMAELKQKGIKAVLVFAEPAKKDSEGACAYQPNGVMQRGIAEIKRIAPDMLVASDVCLCPFKTDGHCGFFDDNGNILRQKTLDVLCKIAVSQAKAGSDIIAPSDMMDGRVGAIRGALDASGFEHVAIMSYSAKYASNYYGPFRQAVDSAPQFGDRKTYQMDFGNSTEAIKEMQLDIMEGADMLMVKPAGAYLDIIFKGKCAFDVPMAAYQVSGEYAMLYHGVKAGIVNKMAIYESLMAIKRSGADIIITYFAKQVKEMIGEI
jgi:porphobilinogen synthase